MNEILLDTVFAALADPTRRAILARLAAGPASVTELGQPFDMSQPAISKHLKVLENAGLIARGRDAQRRPCQLVASPLRAVDGWIADFRAHWEETYAALDDVLEDLKKEAAAKKKRTKTQRRKGRTP